VGQGEFVPQLVAQIPWGHNAVIVEKIKAPDQALWYVRKTLENGWSRNVLALQIDSRLSERQAETPRIDNFTERLPAPDVRCQLSCQVSDNYLVGLVVVTLGCWVSPLGLGLVRLMPGPRTGRSP